jgi:hypothetical protein
MPSTSPAQARLMAAVAHGWHKPGGGGPPVAVAKEFNKADTGKHAFAEGGVVNKGYLSKNEAFAEGGPVLGKESEFLKTPNRFIGGKLSKPEGTEDVFGKGSSTTNPKAKDKSEKPIKPR